MSLVWEIRTAIRQEMEETAPFHEFTIHSAQRDGPAWKLTIDPFISTGALDESLEEASAWWIDSGGGTAEVLSTDIDSHLITIRSATSARPRAAAPSAFTRRASSTPLKISGATKNGPRPTQPPSQSHPPR